MSIAHSLATTPSVSVVIPAYNAARYLGDAIESALRQKQPANEIIVVNDGSTDDTGQIAAGFGSRIQLINQPNGGPSVARNTGVQVARGNWIAFLDADDVWFSDKLEQQIEILQPETLLCGDVVVFTDNDKLIQPSRHSPSIAKLEFAQLLQRNRIVTSTVIVPRAALLKAGGFDRRYRGTEDFDCWLRLAARGLSVQKMTAKVAGYRISPQSLSQQVEKMRDQELQIVTEQMRVTNRESSGRLRKLAIAGVYYRAGIGFAEIQNRWDAISSTLRSFAITPQKLPEYSCSKPCPRVRLLAGCLRSLVRSPLPSALLTTNH